MSEGLIAGKYNYLGRVVATGYRRDPGSPANDPNNPTGWSTGQWIDIVILEVSSIPPKFSRKIYRTGETVTGFWSYGGDDGIVGKPSVGDVVGYFEEPYVRIWEKTFGAIPEKPTPHVDVFEHELSEFKSPISAAYLWLVIVAAFFMLVYGTLESFNVVRFLSLPEWFFPISVLISALWIAACRLLLNKNEFGLTLFSTCAFSFSFLLFKTGQPMLTSLLCSLSIIPLLAIRVWEEHDIVSNTMLVRLLEHAIKEEKSVPPRGLMAYEKFKNANNETHPPVFIAGLLGFPIAYLIAYFLDQWVSRYNVLVTLAVLCIVGAGPLMYANYRQSRKMNSFRRIPKWGFIELPFLVWAIGLTLIFLLFADAFQAAWIGLISAIIMIAILLPYNVYRFYTGVDATFIWGFPSDMTEPARNTMGAIVVLFALLFYFSDARLLPFSLRRFWRELKMGLKENSGKLFDFISNGILTALLAATTIRYEYLYTDWPIGIIAYLVSGAMIGYELSKFKINNILEGLANLGILRCMLKMGQEIETDFYVYLWRDDIMQCPEPIPTIGSAIGIKLIHGSESEFKDAIDYAVEQAPRFIANESLIKENIALTKAL